MKGTNPGAMPENPKQNEWIKSVGDAEEPEKKNEGIEFGCDVGEPENERRDRILA